MHTLGHLAKTEHHTPNVYTHDHLTETHVRFTFVKGPVGLTSPYILSMSHRNHAKMFQTWNITRYDVKKCPLSYHI